MTARSASAPDVGERLEAVHVGHGEVEQDDVGRDRPHGVREPRAVPGLAHDHQIAVELQAGAQQRPQPGASSHRKTRTGPSAAASRRTSAASSASTAAGEQARGTRCPGQAPPRGRPARGKARACRRPPRSAAARACARGRPRRPRRRPPADRPPCPPRAPVELDGIGRERQRDEREARGRGREAGRRAPAEAEAVDRDATPRSRSARRRAGTSPPASSADSGTSRHSAPAGRSVRPQRRLDERHEAVIGELARGQVDRHGELVAGQAARPPVREPQADLLQHPGAEPPDRAGVGVRRQQLVRAREAVVGTVPAHHRLDARERPPRARATWGWEWTDELAALQGVRRARPRCAPRRPPPARGRGAAAGRAAEPVAHGQERQACAPRACGRWRSGSDRTSTGPGVSPLTR